jgi:hypothetical protein
MIRKKAVEIATGATTMPLLANSRGQGRKEERKKGRCDEAMRFEDVKSKCSCVDQPPR